LTLRVPLLIMSFMLATAAYGQAIDGIPTDAFQVRYAANLNVGDSVINITNTGTQVLAPVVNSVPEGGAQGSFAGTLTNICVNVYAFSPDEQLISCCSCVVTPNAVVSLSARNDIIGNTLTPAVPNSIVVKLLATSGTSCNAANAPIINLAAGMRAWGTTLHATPSTPSGYPAGAYSEGAYAVTETAFNQVGISEGELARITAFCGFIQANGSGYGICRSCRLGGLGADKR
jgi:hypothetical protein